jgi:pseudouridine synthase
MISDHGVQLEDGPSKFTVMRESGKRYEITMHEGRNRQIRRTFIALGYNVTSLHRTQFGNYSLDDMKTGEYKTVDMR